MFLKVGLTVCLSTILLGLHAQRKCLHFAVSESISLDTLLVNPESIALTPDLDFHFDPGLNGVVLKEVDEMDSILICYSTISPLVYQPMYKRDIGLYDRGRLSTINDASVSGVPIIPRKELFSLSDFDTYGAITRGVTFGNRQNLFVNSALNLQMDGRLTEELSVSASITDQNIPYQPEGNTQQIRDFDHVYIRLYNEQLNLIAGDVVLTNKVKDGYFLQYYKNVQGLGASYDYQVNDKWTGKSSISGSAAKGQFYSAQIDPIEGVQGPYRLRGPGGERFVIILANSERVFIDGKLMKRGFDRDYVIDYNLGEVTFSNEIVITRFTRIRIDYEYAEQNYSRSNITATQEFSSSRADVYFNYYREKDNPSTTLGFDIASADRELLAQLGDNQGLGLIDGADSVGYLQEAILYEKRDTLVEGVIYTYYKQSGDEQRGVYRVSFSEVGIGKGDYELSETTANGRIYRWVSPVSGVSQGNYAPQKRVPLPNRKEMTVIGGKLNLNNYESIKQELAISRRDENLFSVLDDDDNTGYAWLTKVSSTHRQLGAYKLSANGSYEQLDSRFAAIDRFRPIEFDRDWSYDAFGDTLSRSDRIFLLSLLLEKDKNNALNYQYGYRNRRGIVKGNQHRLTLDKELGPIQSSSRFFMTRNKPSLLRSEWIRVNEDLRWSLPKVEPGYAFELDRQASYLSDSLIGSMMHFYAHNFYLVSGDSSRARLRIDYIRRFDQLPQEGEFRDYTQAEEMRLSIHRKIGKSKTLGIIGNYRKVMDDVLKMSDKNVLGKINWEGEFLNRWIRQNFTYSTANTRELKREFVFINVPTGEGTHTWRDENADGVQDLNEFYEAINQDEKNYAKIFTPTDEYMNAFQSTMEHGVSLGFPEVWRNGGFLVRFLSRVSANSNIRVRYKTTDSAVKARLDLLASRLEQQQVISGTNQQRHTMFFNRNGTGLALDVSNVSGERKTLLTSGFEFRTKDDWVFNVRYTFKSKVTLRGKVVLGKTLNDSDFLISRNFALSKRSWSPEVIWQPASQFRVSTKMDYRWKNQLYVANGTHSFISDYALQSTWIQRGKGNINVRFQWLSIGFQGEPNSFLGYELLEGLQPGQNQKWKVNWQQSLNRGLQLTIQYNGRKSTGVPAIHTGTMQLTAFF